MSSGKFSNQIKGSSPTKRKLEGHGSEDNLNYGMEPKIARSSKSEGAAVDFRNEGMHPLFMEDTLDKILQFVVGSSSENLVAASKEVQNVRLVCRFWRDRATRIFRAMRPQTCFGSWIFEPGRVTDSRLKYFLETMKTSSLIPVQSYELQASIFSMQDKKLIDDFVEICVPDAVKLNLSFRDFCDLHFAQNFSRLNLERLRVLDINCVQFRRFPQPYQNQEILSLIEFLLESAKDLREFSFIFTLVDCEWEKEAERRLAEIFKRVPSSIKTLRLNMKLLSDLHFDIFANKDWKLEELELRFHGVVGCKGAICKFFEKQAQTLKIFTLFLNDYFSSFPFQFPQFGELFRLNLLSYRAGLPPFTIPNAFPKLKVLNAKDLKFQGAFVQILSSPNPAPSVQDLFLPCDFPQAKLVRKAAKCFPNIRKLYVSRSTDIQETLPEVFTYFSEVEKISISFFTDFSFGSESLSGDSLLSGVPEEECERIRHGNLKQTDLGVVRTKPSILNLTKLKKLTLEGFSDVSFTDFLVYFVILKLTGLEELFLNQLKLDPNPLQALKSKLKLRCT